VPVLFGAQTKSTAPTVWTSATAFAHQGTGPHPLGRFDVTAWPYELVFERHLWAQVAVSKLVSLQIQLPFKVYERSARGRLDARDSPLGQLLRRPSQTLDPVTFWTWFILQRHIHGAAFARKVRDNGGRPVRLELIHPTRMRYGAPSSQVWDRDDQPGVGWWFMADVRSRTEVRIDRSEFIAWRRPHPRHPELALSPLEQLRDTLEMEAAARLANRSLMERGGKHSVVLTTPKNFGSGSTAVVERLADQYQRRHGGVENWGRPLILEDGMQEIGRASCRERVLLAV